MKIAIVLLMLLIPVLVWGTEEPDSIRIIVVVHTDSPEHYKITEVYSMAEAEEFCKDVAQLGILVKDEPRWGFVWMPPHRIKKITLRFAPKPWREEDTR